MNVTRRKSFLALASLLGVGAIATRQAVAQSGSGSGSGAKYGGGGGGGSASGGGGGSGSYYNQGNTGPRGGGGRR